MCIGHSVCILDIVCVYWTYIVVFHGNIVQKFPSVFVVVFGQTMYFHLR